MNMNRLRPPPDCDDLALWLSGVINDAVRDAREAGLSSQEISMLLAWYAKHEDPVRRRGAHAIAADGPLPRGTSSQCEGMTPAGNRCSRGSDMCDRHNDDTKHRPAPNPAKTYTRRMG
jgi:hypothetical protein